MTGRPGRHTLGVGERIATAAVRVACNRMVVVVSSFPRRQQYRRLRRAGEYAAATAVAGALSVLMVALGAIPIAAVLLLATAGLAVCARYWARLAGRSRVGARSESEVRRALAPLDGEGWRLRHSLPWQGRGDIDSLAIAPTGTAFAIETKTRHYSPDHLARTRQMSAWLYARRRRWCQDGAVPVLCVVHARQVEHVEAGVLIVSLDRLVSALRVSAGTVERPAFLAPPDSES